MDEESLKPTGMWLAFMLREHCASDNAKEKLKKSIVSNSNVSCSDVVYLTGKKNGGLSYYIFVREYDGMHDMQNIHEQHIEDFEPYTCHVRITDEEMATMVNDLKSVSYGYVKYGDIVLLHEGKYRGLYGIALRRNRDERICVGLKFCFGKVVELCKEEELTVLGNIFNHIKILR